MRPTNSRKSRQRIGALVAELRWRAMMSQRELAEKLGRSPSWVSRVEAGRASVELFEFIRIARVFRLNPILAMERISRELEG